MGRAFEAKNQSMGLKINRRIENSIRKNLTKKRLPGDFGSRFWERCRMCHALHQYERNIFQNVTKNSIKF
nr:MAG TPA: cytochrome c554 [Caudoviricetes sp.]